MSWIYEYNFHCLIELLPELRSPQCCLSSPKEALGGLAIDVVEHHKYTTVIRLSQTLPLPLTLAVNPVMVVRIYHDARVAEVLSYQNHHRFQPRYDYPNPAMCQRREKRRVNEFLGEWLSFCLANDWRLQANTI